MPMSKLRLQIKNYQVDDNPTFAFVATANPEPLTFRNRQGSSSRPKQIYRPSSPPPRSLDDMNALFGDYDDDDDDDVEKGMPVDDKAPAGNCAALASEQRDNLLVSNSASKVVALSAQQATGRVKTLDPRRRQSRSEQITKQEILLGSSIQHPILIDAEEEQDIPVKHEVTARSVTDSPARTKPTISGVLLNKPPSTSSVSDSDSDLSTSVSHMTLKAPSPTESLSAVPSIVLTDTSVVERKTGIENDSTFHAAALEDLLSVTVCYTYQCLSFAHAARPHRDLFLTLRRFAHDLPPESQTPAVKYASKHFDDDRLLKYVRGILKKILGLTGIVKLDAFVVGENIWRGAKRECVHLLKKIVGFVEKQHASRLSRFSLNTDSGSLVSFGLTNDQGADRSSQRERRRFHRKEGRCLQ